MRNELLLAMRVAVGRTLHPTLQLMATFLPQHGALNVRTDSLSIVHKAATHRASFSRRLPPCLLRNFGGGSTLALANAGLHVRCAPCTDAAHPMPKKKGAGEVIPLLCSLPASHVVGPARQRQHEGKRSLR